MQGHKTSCKISWSKGTEIIQSLFYHCAIMLVINIRKYFKTNHIFSGQCGIYQERFLTAIESPDKVKRLEKCKGWLKTRVYLNKIKMRN